MNTSSNLSFISDKMDSLNPEITRALTELFIIVEEKWDMEQDLMLEWCQKTAY